jgi:hypothetical protein
MKLDPILEELLRAKEALARAAAYDVDRVFAELQHLTAAEEQAGRRVIRSSADLQRYAATEEDQRKAQEVLALKESPPPA